MKSSVQNRTTKSSTTNSSTKSWIAPKIELCALHTQSHRTLRSRTSNLPLHSHYNKTTASFESINGLRKSTLSTLVGCTNRIRPSTIATKSRLPFQQPARNSTFPLLTSKFIPKDYHTSTPQPTNASKHSPFNSPVPNRTPQQLNLYSKHALTTKTSTSQENSSQVTLPLHLPPTMSTKSI